MTGVPPKSFDNFEMTLRDAIGEKQTELILIKEM